MTRLIALVLFLSAGIGRSDGYSLDHGETPRSAFRGDHGDRERAVSIGRTTPKSLSSPEQMEADFSDDECFPFEPLQIQCEINGYLIPAIVDTGAQVTVMSESCARRCRVANQIDGRFSGKAVGIGSSDILGRINQLLMRVGPISYHNKVSILRQSRVDLIVGLDFLRRFSAEINLDQRILKLNVRGRTVRIPFIYENKSYLEQSYNKRSSLSDSDTYNDDQYKEVEEENEEEEHEEHSSANHNNKNIEKSKNFPQASNLPHKRKTENRNKNNGWGDNQNQNFGQGQGQGRTEPLGVYQDNTKQRKKEREFVILNSKLNHHKHDDSNEDNDDGNSDDTRKSYLSMEGV
jgi:Aspartyl protease